MPSMQQTVQPDGLRCRRDPGSVQVSAARPCGASGHVGVWKQKNRSKNRCKGKSTVVGCAVWWGVGCVKSAVRRMVQSGTCDGGVAPPNARVERW